MTREQRRLLADKLPDTANVAAGVMVFSPLVGGQHLSAASFVIGAFVWFAAFGSALWFRRK
ncbi:MAG: hypothetical protein HY048_00260 [Acidobacteria bacterium]|nr:hypothetical protein [Acidobacteriota bacterium]